ncbi:diguanylate cyclase (GGDEF)-like protein [Limnobacter thiooxidans]|uniref:diguanylate cyclase n=1 Tax=Limnobacter thiooxidans TaxID=131080 RepID=A0AA86IY31_9BURK|nr:GGDEF domain-containing protein [Limnobacter sp.]MCZ8017107.1 GGDEF domain-containing protein [Limnobacter sp.]RZS37243.1 diguanylate cyclase (GGDEF)-like protein [Limnobacter thiooxidans]BET25502.1 GGDEF domain-containing protein [Limnobacter thiooxidans]
MYSFKQVLDLADSTARAQQRMVFSGLSFLIVLFLAPGGAISGDPVMLSWMVLLTVHFSAAMLQAWLISRQEVHWEKIELPSYLLDLPLIGMGLAVAGEYLAVFSPLLAVVALVRGIRYGPCMLASHTAVAVVIVLLLSWFVPFWGGYDILVMANLFLLLILPVQFYGVSVKIQASSKLLRQENLTDPLTRSLNRKALEAAVWRVLNTREPFVISFLDLDNFKMVNDTMGHATGDKLLRRLCAKLSLRLRVEDKVYRVSGDEFVVLSVGAVRQELAESLGQRIQAAIAEVVQYTCPELPVSASVGVIVVNTFEDVSLEQLLLAADRLMYQAKKAGKNRVIVEQA